MSEAVIGLGFGDEGKGLTTDFLSSGSIKQASYQVNSKMVVRFSGGQQSGHTVVTETFRHVFSCFGSGTLRGIPTFWTHYCTVDPVEIVKEMEILKPSYSVPILFIDPNCPITTPHDKIFQQNNTKDIKHGITGYGVGSTFKREEDFFHLLARDIWNPTILRLKYEQIRHHYYKGSGTFQNKIDEFFEACSIIRNSINIKLRDFNSLEGHHLIFEGSQGLLLDKHIGFFPNVTNSNTGSRNIIEMGYHPEIFLVTRAYQTRHGNGPITNTEYENTYSIKDDDMETNKTNEFQGKFRKSMLDLDLLYHGISTDPYISQLHRENRLNLVITCLDHLESYSFTVESKRYDFKNKDTFIGEIGKTLGIKNLFISESPESKNIIHI